MKNSEYKVHELGLIRVVDYMGDDNAIVQMARVSYGEGTKTVNEDRGLIRYLMRHKHTSPFEGCVVKLHLKMPIFIARQWVRHRTASMNEYSARYSEMRDEFYIPSREYVQPQSKSNKQGRDGELPVKDVFEFISDCKGDTEEAFSQYKKALDMGVARETARMNLPLSIYTEFYWQMNLHNLLHFCSLRSDPHAQKEIRDYSDVILHEIIKQWVPNTYEAFMDYNMNGAHFSKHEVEVIKKLIGPLCKESLPQELSGREKEEFLKKLGRL